MRTLVFGFFAIIGVYFASTSGNIRDYLSLHAAYLVVGGTISILMLSVPWSVLRALLKSIAALFHPEIRLDSYRQDLNLLIKKRDTPVETKSILIQYANDLWVQGTDADLFVVLLSEKQRELDLRGQDAVQALKNLSKYPPALGMAGTVMGMIGLFSELDKNKSLIGQNLSLAMAATFLGLIVSNLFVSPIADRLQIHHARIQQINGSLYELILLIHRGEAKSLIEEEIDGRAA